MNRMPLLWQRLRTILLAAGCCAAATPCGGIVFPAETWETIPPAEAGFDPEKLQETADALVREAGDAPFHLLVIYRGRVVLERHANTDPARGHPCASLAKSVYASLVPIAVRDGLLRSPDDRLVDHYPHIEGAVHPYGPHPKKGHYFTEKDRSATFRQIVTQTAGFLEAGRLPGEDWAYRTNGKVAMMKALGYLYAGRDLAESEAAAAKLIQDKIRDPIGAAWGWHPRNIAYHEEARHDLFGRFIELEMTASDMARFGLLFLAGGRWGEREVIPQDWAVAAGRVAPEVRAVAAEKDWKYGLGFWSNEFRQLWPSLPAESFMAAGFGDRQVWICPPEGLVIALNPGLRSENFMTGVENPRAIKAVFRCLARPRESGR